VPTVVVTASAAALRLSDTVEVTLTATGVAPVRVELPKELLEPASAVAWQITPVRSATSTDGTTWVQTFRLSPFVPGDELLVKFNPIKVNGTEVTPESFTLRVETALRNPTAADARPVTGIEQLPAPPASDPPLILAGVTLLVALVAVLAAVLVAACKRRTKPLSPGEWVREQIGTLQTNLLSGRLTEAEFVQCLATAFRDYLTRRFGLNSEPMTTAELIASADGVWDADTRNEVEDLLTACDAVKFAGRVPSPTDCDALADQAGRLVDGWERGIAAT
jgi:HAMP domain-containing protein